MTRHSAPIELKPRDLGENLGLLFQLSGRYFLPVFLVYGVVALPNMALSLITLEMGADMEHHSTEYRVLNGISSLGQVFVSMLVTPFAIGVSIHLVSAAFTGHRNTPRAAIASTWPRFPALLGYTFVTSLLIGLAAGLVAIPVGIMFFGTVLSAILALVLLVPSLIPACILATCFYVGPCAIAMEECGVTDGIRRTLHLTRARRWQVFGLWVVSVLAAGTIVGSCSGVLFATGTMETPTGQIASWITQITVSVLGVVGPVVMYFSLRCDKEHFDVAMLADLVDHIAATD